MNQDTLNNILLVIVIVLVVASGYITFFLIPKK